MFATTTSAKLAAASLGVALFLSACGSTRSQPARAFNQVIRDPDNPAYVGATLSGPAPLAVRGATIHDPDNPFWAGSYKDANVIDPAQGRGMR